MRFCIFSDVHGNLEALQAVLADAEREGGELVRIFLGDAVGYGPNPNECVELIRVGVKFSRIGNHAEAATRTTDAVSISTLPLLPCEW